MDNLHIKLIQLDQILTILISNYIFLNRNLHSFILTDRCCATPLAGTNISASTGKLDTKKPYAIIKIKPHSDEVNIVIESYFGYNRLCKNKGPQDTVCRVVRDKM